jgi:hypothetical protein
MTENCDPDTARRRRSREKFIAVVEANGIEPFAVHRHGWMVQADHDVFGAARRDRFLHAAQFPFRDLASRAARTAAVDTDDQPVAGSQGIAIGEWRVRQHVAHQVPNVVVPRHAKDRQVERRQEVAAMGVGVCRVILDDVAGQGDKICSEVALAIMFDYRLQRVVGNGPSQGAIPVGKEMRVRQMEDPHRIS